MCPKLGHLLTYQNCWGVDLIHQLCVCLRTRTVEVEASLKQVRWYCESDTDLAQGTVRQI